MVTWNHFFLSFTLTVLLCMAQPLVAANENGQKFSVDENSHQHIKLIFDCRTKSVRKEHWWPIKERTQPGGDYLNNLFALSGPLDLLDKVTGKKSRDYEYTHHRKPIDAENYDDWGHCEQMCEVVSVLDPPRFDVEMPGENGEKILFTKHAIGGLLIKIVLPLIQKTDYEGPGYRRDPYSSIHPKGFTEILQKWGKDGLPIVVDCKEMTSVCFPYDRIKIYESSASFSDKKVLDREPNVSLKFYQIELSGTGFKKILKYEYYTEYLSNGHERSSFWLSEQPGFFWRHRAHEDFMNKKYWKYPPVSNPEIDPLIVRKIYKNSLKQYWSKKNHKDQRDQVKQTVICTLLCQKHSKKIKLPKVILFLILSFIN